MYNTFHASCLARALSDAADGYVPLMADVIGYAFECCSYPADALDRARDWALAKAWEWDAKGSTVIGSQWRTLGFACMAANFAADCATHFTHTSRREAP